MKLPMACATLRPFRFVLLLTVLILAGCSTPKTFYSFSVPSKAYAQAADSVASLEILAETTVHEVPASPDNYPLLASTAALQASLPLASSQSRPQAQALRSSVTKVPVITAPTATPRENVSPRKIAQQEENAPNTKGIHTLVTLGILFGFLSLVLGILGIVTILHGGGALLPVYILTSLAGVILSARALSKIKASPDPTMYEKDRKAAKLGLLLSLVPAALILIIGLAVAVG